MPGNNFGPLFKASLASLTCSMVAYSSFAFISWHSAVGKCASPLLSVWMHRFLRLSVGSDLYLPFFPSWSVLDLASGATLSWFLCSFIISPSIFSASFWYGTLEYLHLSYTVPPPALEAALSLMSPLGGRRAWTLQTSPSKLS